MSQLALDLTGPPAYLACDFLEAACNSDALNWIRRWPAWPGFALALAGPSGCGKSHLAHIFAERSGASLLPAAKLSIDVVGDLESGAGMVIEDADRGVDQTALFHLYNILREQQRPLLLTGLSPPAHWGLSLADLSSRLATLPVAEIGSPDDGLLQALLVKLFDDRQLRVAPDAVAYLLARTERSFDAVRALVDRLDRTALQQGRAVTVPLIRLVLSESSADVYERDGQD